MPLIPGVGARLAARMRELGYVRADGKPDVRRWCLEKGYDKTIVYYWLADRSTPMKDLARLTKDLGVTAGWLLFNETMTAPKRRGRASAIIATAALLASCAAAEARPLPVEGESTASKHYVNRRRRRHGVAPSPTRRRDRNRHQRWRKWSPPPVPILAAAA